MAQSRQIAERQPVHGLPLGWQGRDELHLLVIPLPIFSVLLQKYILLAASIDQLGYSLEVLLAQTLILHIRGKLCLEFAEVMLISRGIHMLAHVHLIAVVLLFVFGDRALEEEVANRRRLLKRHVVSLLVHL